MENDVNPMSQQQQRRNAAAESASQARVHRTVTAVGLVGSAALVAVGGVIAPPNSGRPDELYWIATEASGRLMAEAIVMVVSSILLVFGVIGAARLVQGRGRYLARAAALLGVMGALGHTAYSTFALLLPAIVTSSASRAHAIDTLEAIGSSAGGAVVLPLITAYAISVVLLPVALYRGRLIPLWVVGPAAAAVAIEAFPAGAVDLSLAKYALALATATAIAARILQLSDDQWRNPHTTIERTGHGTN
ncbi:hypothetical protein EV643_114252 [Kribbella sp. VKM Ac-2527]|uniref:Integral membrane protein n=1 Tax=Kribbella caucasensis TaxID=2512215 RepID=A0A4R6K9F1_9ACTN|nr:hypothetical protein [Kribbella sp. VKM Ac-2527]TDO45107.1 hypothetical protein EV643_114252 [Kribbella sp. VKM Ac-2527]